MKRVTHEEKTTEALGVLDSIYSILLFWSLFWIWSRPSLWHNEILCCWM